MVGETLIQFDEKNHSERNIRLKVKRTNIKKGELETSLEVG